MPHQRRHVRRQIINILEDPGHVRFDVVEAVEDAVQFGFDRRQVASI